MSDKLRELVLYITKKTVSDLKFGATKRAKVLFMADFEQYAATGTSITGARYVKAPHGPIPDSLKAAIESLKSDGSVKETHPKFHGLRQKRLTARREVDASLFEAGELELVDRVIERFGHMTATDVSDWSHNFVPWKLADYGEEIPYYTVFAMSADLNPGERGIAWAKRELKRLREEESYSH